MKDQIWQSDIWCMLQLAIVRICFFHGDFINTVCHCFCAKSGIMADQWGRSDVEGKVVSPRCSAVWIQLHCHSAKTGVSAAWCALPYAFLSFRVCYSVHQLLCKDSQEVCVPYHSSTGNHWKITLTCSWWPPLLGDTWLHLMLLGIF